MTTVYVYDLMFQTAFAARNPTLATKAIQPTWLRGVRLHPE